MDDLIEFLRARLADEEPTARAATPGPWTPDVAEETINAAEGVVARVRDFNRVMTSAQAEADTVLIARHADPARVLTDGDAKWAVVRIAEAARDFAPTFTTGFAAKLEHALRLFALAYADHPDYRAEWAPGA
jgi:hypothetical protein